MTADDETLLEYEMHHDYLESTERQFFLAVFNACCFNGVSGSMNRGVARERRVKGLVVDSVVVRYNAGIFTVYDGLLGARRHYWNSRSAVRLAKELCDAFDIRAAKRKSVSLATKSSQSASAIA